jgi:hypothetical protein
MYENKDFKGQLVKLFESVEDRIGSSYGIILSRSKVFNKKLVQSYFKSVESRMALVQLSNRSEEYKFFLQPACKLKEYL